MEEMLSGADGEQLEETRKAEVIDENAIRCTKAELGKGCKLVEKFGDNGTRLVVMTEDGLNKMNATLKEKIGKLNAKMKEKAKKVEEMKSELEEKDSILEKVEEALWCSQCLAVPRGNRIPVCKRGHVICTGCLDKRDGRECPVCQTMTVKANDRFSIAFGKIADVLQLACANQGCSVRLIRPSLLEHEATCFYSQNLDCPNDCEGKVSVANCIDHLVNSCEYPVDVGQVNLDVPYTRVLKFSALDLELMEGWNHLASPMKVDGTDDHIIGVGHNVGNLVLVSFKCLSAVRSRRYKIKIELRDQKSGQSKINVGETLLMTENPQDCVEDGNILEIHRKAFNRFKEGGVIDLIVTVNKPVELLQVIKEEEAQVEEEDGNEELPDIHEEGAQVSDKAENEELPDIKEEKAKVDDEPENKELPDTYESGTSEFTETSESRKSESRISGSGTFESGSSGSRISGSETYESGPSGSGTSRSDPSGSGTSRSGPSGSGTSGSGPSGSGTKRSAASNIFRENNKKAK